MQKKAFVLLSGGLDSTTALYLAIEQFKPDHISHAQLQHIKTLAFEGVIDWSGIDWVEAISIDYGQRHLKETEYARRTCDKLGINHSTLSLGELLSGVGVMLTDKTVAVPDVAYSDIKGVSPTYVPFRNGLMLSAIAAHAQKYVNAQIEGHYQSSLGYIPRKQNHPEIETAYKSRVGFKEATDRAKDIAAIYFGAHADDALNWAYPDCTPEFIGAMANAIYVGTYNTVRLFAPFASLSKGQIVSWGNKLGVQYESTWSCYKGEDKHCGVCPTCRSRKEAFIEANVEDPTDYAQ